jgi:hypothetical protein
VASAAEILGSAAAAAGGSPGGRVSSYHLQATRTTRDNRQTSGPRAVNGTPGETDVTQLEVWFGGNGQFREEIQDPELKTVLAD